jgi:hypothetical protein
MIERYRVADKRVRGSRKERDTEKERKKDRKIKWMSEREVE